MSGMKYAEGASRTESDRLNGESMAAGDSTMEAGLSPEAESGVSVRSGCADGPPGWRRSVIPITLALSNQVWKSWRAGFSSGCA